MRKTLITILQYVIFLGLGIWIIFHMMHQLTDKQKTELISAIQSVNLWYILPIFVVGFLSHFFRALRWRLLLETLKVHPSVVNTTFAVLIGYLANLVLPRAGEVAKCTVLARYERTPAHNMIGTIVAERAFDILCLVIITIAAFLLQANVIGSYAEHLSQVVFGKMQSKAPLIFAGLVVFVLLILLLNFFYRRNKETKVGQFIKGMSDGVRSIIHMKKRWEFIGYTFLIWLMYTFQIYLGFLSLPATHHLSILAALVVLIFGSVGMITTPGGIGAYTLLVAEILVFYSISDVSAQAFGWVAWAVQTGIICILGIISLVLLPILNRNRYAQAPVDTKQNI
ncbi:MAG TPA: lysylphosphatidylglycerol synthase transmembrane domain-containing protein [Flavipsychrobacter sp.]|nr:lysylphosphatidylglycerol synthase transmembrane domain-containing protein [Flavipsychrobacter sp.]